MVKKNFKALLLGAALCVGFGGYGVAENVTASATETKSATDVAWQMSYGASVRVPNDGANIGIRYTVQMPAADYAALNAYGYQDLSYGVLIAPADYVSVKPLNAANVFGVGGDKVYDWATWDETTETWVYSGSLTRIINLETDELTVNAKNSSIVEYKGSIINLDEINKTRAFVGLGYIKYSADGENYSYEFADWAYGENDQVSSIANNTRSMAQVVTKAVADTSEDNPLTDTQKTALQNAYHKDVDYVVRTYKEIAGVYQETTEENATAIAEWKTANAANVGASFNVSALGSALSDSEYYYDTWKSETVAENTIPETGRAYFDLYYSAQDNTDYTFENMGYLPSSFVAKNTTSDMFSIATVTGMDGEQTKALKMSNANGNQYSGLSINLGTEFFANVTQNSVLKFKVYLDSTVGNVGWFYFKVTPQETATTWLYQDARNVNKDVWVEYCIPYADLTKDISDTVPSMVDSGWMHLYPEQQSVGSSRNFNMYVDDIRLEEVDNVYDFENMTFAPTNVTTRSTGSTTSIEKVTLGGVTTKALKLTNNSDSWPYLKINLGTDFFANVTTSSALKFKVYLETNECNATNYYMQVGSEETLSGWFYDVTPNVNGWQEYQLSYEDLTKAFTNAPNGMIGSGWLVFYPQMFSATNKKVNLYVDDIRLDEYKFDGTFESLLTDAFPTNITVACSYGGISGYLMEKNNTPVDSTSIGGGTALRINTNSDIKAGNPIVRVSFGDTFNSLIKAGSKVTFRVYVTKAVKESGDAMQLAVGTSASASTNLRANSVIDRDTWVDIECTFTEETYALYDGGLHIYLNHWNGSATDRAHYFYFDDFKVVNA